MAWWLGHLISNPEVLILKPLSGSNVDSAFYPFEFLVPGIPGDFVVKSILSSRSGSIALRQLNPFHKKGPQSFKNFHDQCNIFIAGLSVSMKMMNYFCEMADQQK